MRIAALGLDAAEWWLVEQLMDEGLAPNLAAMRAGGTLCRLENLRAFRAEAPWTQFATGRPPGDTGYWSLVQYDPETYEVWERGAYDYDAFPPFWRGLRPTSPILFDLPQTRPEPDLGGTQVMAWGAHSAQYPRASNPKGLLREIDARFGPHPAYAQDNEPCWYDPAYFGALVEALHSGARTRIDVLRWLMERQPDWDLLMSVMSESHAVGHHGWHGVDPRHPFGDVVHAAAAGDHVRAVYRALDEQVGRLGALLPQGCAFVVFSVHGMQPNAGDLAAPMAAEVLHRLRFGRGLVQAPSERWRRRRGEPVVVPQGRWSVHMKRAFREVPPDGVRRFWWEQAPEGLRRVQQDLRRRLKRQSPPRRATFPEADIPPETDQDPADLAGELYKDISWQLPTWYRRSWPDMDAFVLPGYADIQIRVNVEGRERNGRVPAGDFDRACDAVEAELRRCCDARTGRPLVSEVIRTRPGDAHAPGPAPDLVVVCGDPFDAIVHPDAGLVGPYPMFRPGEHSSNGFALMTGPGIPAGRDLGARPALDLSATIAAIAAGAPPEGLAGTPMLVPAVVG